ncbi:hypothetical protein OC846_005647 [Tilletia horrida]|uniref:Uncharacterized protein n=1 Tax=Tilletia horrida TaxID=155126 RepID=A0AAN6GKV7_9BASI|nr:hypothetical protein OC846_005647 [Tilletia horrida]KAK0562722.1 hypothetical protein OC861_005165 [Tilletia horrida]
MLASAVRRAAASGGSSSSATGSARWTQTVNGFTPHRPSALHRYTATLLGASMWFFIFYRAKQDGAVMLGLKHPWDGHDHHHGDGHDEHAEEHH